MNLFRLHHFVLVAFFISTLVRANGAESSVTPQASAPTSKVAANPSDTLFSPHRLVEIRIDIAAENWNTLRYQHHDLIAYLSRQRLENPAPQPYTTYKADISIDGVKVKSVGIRKKGFLGSADVHRPSLNIYFDQYVERQRFAGLRKIALNNNKQDASQMHQALAYHVFAVAGVPAPRCNLARVTVNGKELGIYSLVEPVDGAFLKRNFKNGNGNLYEGTISDFRPEWAKTFERKTNKRSADRSDVEAVVAALQSDDGELLSKLDPLIDIDAYLTFWAVEGLIGHWDSYSNNQNNFFVYGDPAIRKFHFIAWGADSCFGDPDPFTSYKPPESVKAVSLLPRRLYNLPATREKYRDRLRHVLETVWNEKELLAEVDRLETLLKNRAHVSPEQFAAAVSQVRQFIQTRRGTVQPELDGPAPEWTHPLKRAPYMEKIGKLTSTFTTTWQNVPPLNPFANGTVALSLALGGETQKLSMAGIMAGPNQKARGVGSPTISLIGLRGSDGKLLMPLLIFEPEFFSANPSLKVDAYSVLGIYLEGFLGKDEPKIAGLLDGTLNLKEATTKPGGTVSGSLEADLYQFLQ